MDLGKLIDTTWELRAKRLAAQRAVDAMEAEEKALNEQIGEALRKAKLDGGKGKAATAAFRRTQVAQVVDEDALLAWGKLKANRDVIKVGVVGEAWRARLADGVKVPGVETFLKEQVVLTKAGG